MATGFGTFTSASYVTVGSQRAYARAKVSQSINTTNRTVTITVKCLLTCYRVSGNWTVPSGTSIFSSTSGSNTIQATLDGSTTTVGSGGKLGLKGTGQNISAGNYYDTDGTYVAANDYAAATKSITYNYNSSGSAITKSWSVKISYSGTNMTCSGNVTTDSISPTGSPPTNYSVSNIIPQWDRITFTSIVGTPNGTLTSHCPSIQKEPLIGGRQKYENTYSSGTINATITSTVSNQSSPINNPTWTIKGCGFYYTGAYAKNNVSDTALYGQGDYTFTPPSPPTISYTDVTTQGTRTYPVIFTNDPNNNETDYDIDNLTRYLRYKIGDGDWVVVVNNQNARIDDITRFNLTLRAGAVATIQGYMTYQGIQSETVQITITNNSPVQSGQMYGSVSNLSKKLNPIYATFGNYFDPRKKILRDTHVKTSLLGNSITATKTSTGSGTYHWIAYPIEETDELINKKVILEGSFKTSGNFTSGVRLWWLNSSNTNILSGPVNSIEYIGNSGKFSVSGLIPARPSNAGKLALLLYSNIASATQGAFTIFDDITFKADTKNLFNYTTVLASGSGLTNTLATDGTITTTGIVTANYSKIIPTINITDSLEDGCWYTMYKAIDIPNNAAYFEVRRRNTGGTYTYCATNGSRVAAAFKVDKTNFTEYSIYFQSNTTSVWGTESRTFTSKHQLEKGIDMTGENLINPFTVGTGTTNGIDYSVAKDGKITISGTATAAAHIQIPLTLDQSLVGSRISIILDGKLDGFSNFAPKNNTTDVSGIGTLNPAVPAVTTNPLTSTQISDIKNFDFYITSGSVVDASFYIKIKKGDLNSSFAPYIDTKTKELTKIYASVDGKTKLIYDKDS